MEEGKRTRAEFHLPEAIIQHIQSFLNGKEAAQTTILSKSWYNAWLTRPNLDFDKKDFERESDDDTESSANRFRDFVEKTVERYETLNLKIDSLRLSIYDDSCDPKCYSCYSYVNELIVKALKMGATGLDLSFYWGYTLPIEVFGSENLMRLSVSGFEIDLGVDEKVRCSRLESLTLYDVNVEGDIIWDIISSCPLIENLSLYSDNELALSPFIEFGKWRVGSVVDSPFNKLKCLLLSEINVDDLFFDDFSSKFPCLKDLSVHDCTGYKGIQISSPLLECISFRHKKMLRVKFDVPSIRKFVFSGSSIPSLSFTTTTSNWESDISIRYSRTLSATWFLKLNNILTKLSLSKLFLFLRIETLKRFDCAEDIKGLPKPEVENLTIHCPNPNYPALFDALFQCCRPIYVTQDYLFTYVTNKNFMEFVYKSIVNQRMSGECDLVEVDVEFFDEAVSAWRPRLLDASTSQGADKQIIRLHLGWGR